MTSAQLRIRPGVYFQGDAPEGDDPLPRMDVAAFVGFAAAGPLDVPVPIEDVRRFREIFGPDLPLARDGGGDGGGMGRSFLGAAVREFFRGGGRRCHVVRVAGPGAVNHRLPIPGLLRLSGGGRILPALAMARSPGSFAESLRVESTLLRSPLPLRPRESAVHVQGQGLRLSLRGPGRADLSPGDTLRVRLRLFPSFPGEEAEAMLRIGTPDWAESMEVGSRRRVQTAEISAEDGDFLLLRPFSPGAMPVSAQVWFSRAEAVPEAEGGGGPLPGNASVERSSGFADVESLPASPEGPFTVHLGLQPGMLVPQPGTVIPLALDSGRMALLAVEESSQEQGFLTGSRVWEIVDMASEDWSGAEVIAAETLTFTLSALDDAGGIRELRELGMDVRHPRGWQNLPSDGEMYSRLADARPDDAAPRAANRGDGRLLLEASQPRFPLCSEKAIRGEFCFPLGMSDRPRNGLSTGVLGPAEPRSRLLRDGLADFVPDLFLDRSLSVEGASTLEAKAFDQRYIRNRPLRGLHALYFLEEISILSVPDAVHPGWKKGVPEQAQDILAGLLRAPDPLEGTVKQVEGLERMERVLQVSWKGIPDALQYLLQESADADFRSGLSETRVSGTLWERLVAEDCPRTRYFRARAEAPGRLSPWSGTLAISLPVEPAQSCCLPFREACEMAPVVKLDGGEVLLSWKHAEAGAGCLVHPRDRYRVEEAAEFGFSMPAWSREVEGDSVVAPRRTGCLRYFRVRAVSLSGTGNPIEGAWSNTVWAEPEIPGEYIAHAPEDYDGRILLEVHQAMLRLCAARCDLFSVLSLPRHFRALDVEDYLGELTGAMDDREQGAPVAFEGGEEKALSYGGLFHPWVRCPLPSEGNRKDTESAVRAFPPDGAAAGAMAARALGRGAWIAPANDVLPGVLGLTREFSASEWETMLAGQVNILRPQAGGFGIGSAYTLSRDPDYLEINVRRLMILIRRLALREGNRLVFEPNSERTWRLARRIFEGFLGRLFGRGAFAGASQDASFRVDVGEKRDPAADADQGRLLLEIRVAPSLPLEFLVLRLVQAANGRPQVLEG